LSFGPTQFELLASGILATCCKTTGEPNEEFASPLRDRKRTLADRVTTEVAANTTNLITDFIADRCFRVYETV
jgi:hypothetical protein